MQIPLEDVLTGKLTLGLSRTFPQSRASQKTIISWFGVGEANKNKSIEYVKLPSNYYSTFNSNYATQVLPAHTSLAIENAETDILDDAISGYLGRRNVTIGVPLIDWEFVEKSIAGDHFKKENIVASPLGVEIGKANIADVESKYKISEIQSNVFNGGKIYNISSMSSINFPEVKNVQFFFSRNKKLDAMYISLATDGFEKVFSMLSKKYKTSESRVLLSGGKLITFTSKNSYIELDYPKSGNEIILSFASKDFYSKYQQKKLLKPGEKRKLEESLL